MSQTKTIIEIDYHTDDETGMYDIGELDYGISGEATTYVEKFGREKLVAHLRRMADMIEKRDLIPNYTKEEEDALHQKLLDSRLDNTKKEASVRSFSARSSIK